MKKKISIVLVLTMVLSMFSGFAFADTNTKDVFDVVDLIGIGNIEPGKDLALDIFNDYLTNSQIEDLKEEIENYETIRNGLATDGVTRNKVRDLVNLADELQITDLVEISGNSINIDFEKLEELKEEAIAILGSEIVNRVVETRGNKSNTQFAYDLISKIINKRNIVKYDTYTNKFTIDFNNYKKDAELKTYLSDVFPNAFPLGSIDARLDTAEDIITYILNDDSDFNPYKEDLQDILSDYAFYSTYSSKPTQPDPGTGGGGGGGVTPKPETPKTEQPKIENGQANVELGKDAVEVKTGDDGQSVVEVKSESIKAAVDSLVAAIKDMPNTKPVVTVKLDDVETAAMEVTIPKDAMTKLIENKVSLVIESKALTYEVPAEALETALKDIPESASVEFNSEVVSVEEAEKLFTDENVAKTAKVIEFSLSIKDKDGKEISRVDQFNSKIKIAIEIEAVDGNPDLLGVFYINEETGALEFVGGKVKGGKIFMSTDHYSKFAVVEYNKSFKDIENHWSKDYVQSMVAKHIVDGFTDANLYKPEDQLTRAQFAKLIVETLEMEMTTSKGEFTDVKSNHWAKDYIATAKQFGIVGGYDDGTFKPDQSITRAEMAVMLANSLGLKKTTNSIVLNAFKDKGQIPTWAVEYMAPVVVEKLLVGNDGVLNPLGNITRAEAATIIYRVYNR